MQYIACIYNLLFLSILHIWLFTAFKEALNVANHELDELVTPADSPTNLSIIIAD